MHGGRGRLDQLGNGTGATQVINHNVSFGSHDPLYAIIGSSSQVKTSDIRDCDIRIPLRKSRMAKEIKTKQAVAVTVLRRLDALGLNQRELAEALELEENKISKIRAGERRLQAEEADRAVKWLDLKEEGRHIPEADLPTPPAERAYLPVEILPSYGGMGGGGTGEGDNQIALIPRHLVEDELRAKPTDLLLIEARGESMMPDFHHGDQILIDKRDCNPVQPGAFALWDGDGYVVKLVERIPRQEGRYRIFSANGRFSAYDVAADEVRIIGRPVWFGRRL